MIEQIKKSFKSHSQMKKKALQENKTQVHLMRNTVEANGQNFFRAGFEDVAKRETAKEIPKREGAISNQNSIRQSDYN